MILEVMGRDWDLTSQLKKSPVMNLRGSLKDSSSKERDDSLNLGEGNDGQ